MTRQSCTVCGYCFEPLEHVPTCRECCEPACLTCMVQVNEDERIVGTCRVCVRIAELDEERAVILAKAGAA